MVTPTNERGKWKKREARFKRGGSNWKSPPRHQWHQEDLKWWVKETGKEEKSRLGSNWYLRRFTRGRDEAGSL